MNSDEVLNRIVELDQYPMDHETEKTKAIWGLTLQIAMMREFIEKCIKAEAEE